MNSPGYRFFYVFLIYALILVSGTLGYWVIESWSWIDSLYMTVITISTVGFGEVAPLSHNGKLFTVALVLLGVGGFTYFLSAFTDYVVKGQIRNFLRERRKQMEIRSLKNHYIVCGFGRVGVQVCEELKREGKTILVVENEPKACDLAKEKGFLTLMGNANDDNILSDMGVSKAKGLIATLNTDEANLMLVLTARSENPNLIIIARSNYETNEKKLMTAGATRVISPYSIGGRRMAQSVARPNVVEFLDVVMHSDEVELCMEDFQIKPNSRLDGSKIGEVKIREKTGVNIVGIRSKDGSFKVSPEPNAQLGEGDIIMALGTREQLAKFSDLAC